MPITPLPTPPARTDAPEVFSERADAFLGALPTMVTEANALQADVNAKQATATAAAATATGAAGTATTQATAAAASATAAAASATAAATAAADAEHWAEVAAEGAGVGSILAVHISDSSAIGRAVLTAATAAEIRAALGAGTSSLALGTTAVTAKAGNWLPAWSEVTGKPEAFTPTAHAHSASDINTGTLANARTTGTASNTAGTLVLRGASGEVATGALTVTGTITASGDITAFSDARFKREVDLIASALPKVLALRGVTFLRGDEPVRRTGLIAQDVEAVLPEAVVVSTDGFLSVAYGNLAGLFVEAIRELEERVARLERTR